MPKTKKESAPKKVTPGAKYIKQKKTIKELSETQPLNTLRFENNYFEIMHNEWLLDKYILERGCYSTDAYSNTLPAIKEAVKQKKPTTISVQLTSDGVAILYKDSTLAKLGENGYVANTKFDELKDLTIVGTDNVKVCTLDTALEAIANKVPVVIEVINTNSTLHEVEPKVLASIDEYMTKYNMREGVAIMSINPFTLEWFVSNAPHLPRILKSGKFKAKMYGNMKTKELRKLKYHTIAQADYIAYPAHDLPCKHIKKAKPVGVIAYRVTDARKYKKVVKYCDNIMYCGFEPSI